MFLCYFFEVIYCKTCLYSYFFVSLHTRFILYGYKRQTKRYRMDNFIPCR